MNGTCGMVLVIQEDFHGLICVDKYSSLEKGWR